MEAKFEIGNEVKHIYKEECAVIEAVYEGKYGVAYGVRVEGHNEHGEMWLEEDCAWINAHPRSFDGFIEKLRLLFDEYDASISFDFWKNYDDEEFCSTTIEALGESVEYSEISKITADNVLNYDKGI